MVVAKKGETLREKEKTNQPVYIDDIEIFDKNEKELEILVQTIRIYSKDRDMEFGIEKLHTYIFLRTQK